MSIARWAALAALVVPFAATASHTFNVQTSNCSGELVSSFTNGVSLSCQGDYTLSGGQIESSDLVFLKATGVLSLTGVTVNAPAITFEAGAQLLIDASSSIRADGVVLLTPSGLPPGPLSLSGGDVKLRDGDVRLAPAVPEPGSLALVMAGLLAASTLMARQRKSR